jgi:hypothetical protein
VAAGSLSRGNADHMTAIRPVLGLRPGQTAALLRDTMHRECAMQISSDAIDTRGAPATFA